MRASRLAIGLIVLALGISGTAGADTAEDVTVGFGIEYVVYTPWPVGMVSAPPTDAACQLRVAEGANGFTVLDAAVSQKCIDSYETEDDQVRCIDGWCSGRSIEGNLSHWVLSESLDLYRASDDGRLIVSLRFGLSPTLPHLPQPPTFCIPFFTVPVIGRNPEECWR